MNCKKRFSIVSRKCGWAGFTLIELIVVIAVLSILGGVGTVGYTGYVKNANKKATNLFFISFFV